MLRIVKGNQQIGKTENLRVRINDQTIEMKRGWRHPADASVPSFKNPFAPFPLNSNHGVLVWWGNLWLESAISAEASGHLSSTLPGGQLGEL